MKFKNPCRFHLPMIACVIGLAAAGAQAAFTVTYNFNDAGSSPYLTASVTGSDSAAVNAANFDAPGTNATVSGTTDTAYIRTNHTADTEAGALAASTDYFVISLQAANPGQFLNLDSFTFDFGGSSNNLGAYTASIVVQSSVGGFGTGNPTLTVTPSSYALPNDNNSIYLTAATVDLSSSAFDHLSAITFQLRFYDDVPFNDAIDRMDNLVITGSIVPEPASLGLLCLAGLTMIRRRR